MQHAEHTTRRVLGSVASGRRFYLPGDDQLWRIVENDGHVGGGSRYVFAECEASGEQKAFQAGRGVDLVDDPALDRGTPYPWET